MFQKVLLLLLLVVFFQAILTKAEGQTMTEEIRGGLEVGKALVVFVDVDKEITLKIFIKTKPGGESGDGDIGLFVTYNYENGKFITNSKVDGSWLKEKTYWHKRRLAPKIEIVVEQDYFVISFDGRQYYVDHHVPLEKLKYWEIYSSASSSSSSFYYKWYRDFVPCTCQSA